MSRLVLSLATTAAAAAAAADAADGDAADTPNDVVVNDVDAVDGVNADNNGRSSLSFEGTSRSIASGAFSTSSGLL